MLPSWAPLNVALDPPKLGRKTPMTAVMSSTSPPATGRSPPCPASGPRSIVPPKYGEKRPKSPFRPRNFNAGGNPEPILSRDKFLPGQRKRNGAPTKKFMSMNLNYGERQKHLDLRLSRTLHGCVDWLVAGPAPQPPPRNPPTFRANCFIRA